MPIEIRIWCGMCEKDICEPESADSLDIENGWDIERVFAKMLADNDGYIDYCKECREAMDYGRND